jgi:hypothetical protein
MSVSETFRGVADVESIELAGCTNEFHLEPRCRICRDDQVRKKPYRPPAMPAVLRAPPPRSNSFPSNRYDSTDDRGAHSAQTTAAHARGERNKRRMSVTSNDHIAAPMTSSPPRVSSFVAKVFASSASGSCSTS